VKANDNRARLREEGVVVLRTAIPLEILRPLRRAAEACFAAVDPIQQVLVSPTGVSYGFSPFSHSVLLKALVEFGLDSHEDLVAPLSTEGLSELLADAMGEPVTCRQEESWVRKRFAPRNARRPYQPNVWHQDGGLGVAFTPDRDAALPMTRLLTCWVPLQSCGRESPGLEFVRRGPESLLHYTQLDDVTLRQHFSPDQFWAPELQFGDLVVFLARSLHRTYVTPDMTEDRLSVEYRFFPP